MLAWFALKTRSRHEKLVAAEMRRRDVECFLPLVRARRHWSDRVKDVEEPLFSTYLFVRIDPLERLRVLRARGAVALLGAGGKPSPVNSSELESLRAAAGLGGHLEPHRFLRAGQRVRVRDGAFRGVEGILVRRNGRAKLVLSVDVLRQAAALEIDAGDVEAS